MSMRRVFSLLFLLALPAAAQYNTSYTSGVADLTPYVNTSVLWLEIPGGGVCQQGTAAEGYDGWVFCKGMNGQVYKRDFDARTWAAIPAMGTSVVALAVRDKGTVWALIPDAYCQALVPAAFGVYKWAGSSGWTQPLANVCLNQITIGNDGTLAGILDKPSSAQIVLPPSNDELHYSTDGGKTWTNYGANWTFVSLWSKNIGCAISGQRHLYQISFYSDSSGSLGPVSLEPLPTPNNPIPPPFNSCVIPQSDPVVMAVDPSGAIWLNPPDRNIIPGNATQLMSASKGATLALDAQGHVNHWNIYPEILMGQTTGTFENACPGGSPCPSNIKHEIQLGINYPHSISSTCGNCGAGQFQDQFIAPTAAASVRAWDVDPFCDPFFGDPTSPECTPAPPTGEDICPTAGVIGSPSPIGVPEVSNAFVKKGIGPVYYAPPVNDGVEWTCRSTWPVQSNCLGGTVAHCPVAALQDKESVKPNTGLALAACEADTIAAPYQGPWLAPSVYFPNGGLNGPIPGCFQMKVVEHVPAGYCD